MAYNDTLVTRRFNALTGPNDARAVQLGLALAKWYRAKVPRKVMKELMQRSDWPTLHDTAIRLGFLVLTGVAGMYFWGSLARVPFSIVYGVLHGSACDSRWHECGHGTAFRLLKSPGRSLPHGCIWRFTA